jgi:hypothetical protein
MDGKRANSVAKAQLALAMTGKARPIRHPGFAAALEVFLGRPR